METNDPRSPSAPTGGAFSLDGDVALLLGLLLLLRSEGADDALLLALLYIML